MLTHKSVQIALGSLGMLAWLALYLLVRFGNRDLRRWRPHLLALGGVLAAIWLGCWITDHERMGSVFQLNAYGFWGASFWLSRRYKLNAPPITTLDLSAGRALDGRENGSDQHSQPKR